MDCHVCQLEDWQEKKQIPAAWGDHCHKMGRRFPVLDEDLNLCEAPNGPLWLIKVWLACAQDVAESPLSLSQMAISMILRGHELLHSHTQSEKQWPSSKRFSNAPRIHHQHGPGLSASSTQLTSTFISVTCATMELT